MLAFSAPDTQLARTSLGACRKNFVVSIESLQSGRLHTAATAAFSHRDFAHLFANMFSAWGGRFSTALFAVGMRTMLGYALCPSCFSCGWRCGAIFMSPAACASRTYQPRRCARCAQRELCSVPVCPLLPPAALYFFGRDIARLFGGSRLLALYLAGGVVGSLAHCGWCVTGRWGRASTRRTFYCLLAVLVHAMCCGGVLRAPAANAGCQRGRQRAATPAPTAAPRTHPPPAPPAPPGITTRPASATRAASAGTTSSRTRRRRWAPPPLSTPLSASTSSSSPSAPCCSTVGRQRCPSTASVALPC